MITLQKQYDDNAVQNTMTAAAFPEQEAGFLSASRKEGKGG